MFRYGEKFVPGMENLGGKKNPEDNSCFDDCMVEKQCGFFGRKSLIRTGNGVNLIF
jgi:hypothetical protein